jgi:hypothetical protein
MCHEDGDGVMHVIMVVHGVASTGELFNPPQYLKSYDIEAHEGRGDAELTADPSEAVRFDDMAHGMAVWRTQSVTRPLRDDGKPNRPLTAYHVEFTQVP